MNALVVYASKHGSAEDCAKAVGGKLTGRVELINLKEKVIQDISVYDEVIIGGSIYAGRIQKEVTEFCSKNLQELRSKNLGLFICCMNRENAKMQLESSFPKELIDVAKAKEGFGGEFRFKKMNFFERFIVKAIYKKDKNNPILDTSKDVSSISEEVINGFVQTMNNVAVKN
jgi:menaquinone-dependent protoporphyrinogen oxidase